MRCFIWSRASTPPSLSSRYWIKPALHAERSDEDRDCDGDGPHRNVEAQDVQDDAQDDQDEAQDRQDEAKNDQEEAEDEQKGTQEDPMEPQDGQGHGTALHVGTPRTLKSAMDPFFRKSKPPDLNFIKN